MPDIGNPPGGFEVNITGFASRVGAFLLTDLVDCLGDTPQLARSICRALKDGLISLEFDEKLVVVTEAGLQAAGLSDLGPCKVRRYNVLELIEGARLTMSLERWCYPVYGPREQQAMRSAGREVPCPVVRESAEMRVTCSPGHLLQVYRQRPISLQQVLQPGVPSPRLREVVLALHRCDELAGVIYYVPDINVRHLEGLLSDAGVTQGAILTRDSCFAVNAVMSERGPVIVPESARSTNRCVDISRLMRGFATHDATHDTTTICYQAAAEAINHALPELHVLLEADEARELIERVLAVPLERRPAPPRDPDARIGFTETVTKLAQELRWHDAETCGTSYEHAAERILEQPLQDSMQPQR